MYQLKMDFYSQTGTTYRLKKKLSIAQDILVKNLVLYSHTSKDIIH